MRVTTSSIAGSSCNTVCQTLFGVFVGMAKVHELVRRKGFTDCLSCKSWHSSSSRFEKDEKGIYESMIVYDTACHEDREQPLPLHLPTTITLVNSLPLQRFPALQGTSRDNTPTAASSRGPPPPLSLPPHKSPTPCGERTRPRRSGGRSIILLLRGGGLGRGVLGKEWELRLRRKRKRKRRRGVGLFCRAG